MIREFRKYSTGLLAKLLMFALVASFALWGIGDIFRSGARSNYLIRIANHSITAQQFQQQLNTQLANYRQLLGDDYSPEVVKQLGLPQLVLSEMANRLLLQVEAESLGITLSDEAILKLVSQNKMFMGPRGFDKDNFHAMLQHAGLTEENYLTTLTNETASNLMLEMLDGSVLVQRPALKALYRLRGESREATLYTFSPESPAEIKAPADEKLQSYFDDHQALFTIPEYRKISYITLMPSKLRDSVETSEKTLRKLYETRKDAFLIPEKRQISQLLYNNKEQAAQAHALLVQGNTFADTARKIAPGNKELNLGYLTRADLTGESRDIVFDLKKGAFSNPVETAFGWHVFRVTGIKAPVIPDYEEIKPQLRDELVDSQLEDKLYNLSVEIEDRLASGEKLPAIAKEMDLDFTVSAFFDQSGTGPGSKNISLPPVKNLMNRVFGEDMSDTPEFQLGTDKNYYFITLHETKPAALPELEKIRDEVLKHWKEDTIRSRLAKRVQKIAASLREGDVQPLGSTAYRTAQTGTLMRDIPAEGDDLPADLQNEIFTLAKGKFSHAYPLENGDWAIARLDAVHPMPKKEITDADLAALKNELSEQYSEELVQYYLAWLSRKYPVDANETALNSLLR